MVSEQKTIKSGLSGSGDDSSSDGKIMGSWRSPSVGPKEIDDDNPCSLSGDSAHE
jgi:hypothetical protein